MHWWRLWLAPSSSKTYSRASLDAGILFLAPGDRLEISARTLRPAGSSVSYQDCVSGPASGLLAHLDPNLKKGAISVYRT